MDHLKEYESVVGCCGRVFKRSRMKAHEKTSTHIRKCVRIEFLEEEGTPTLIKLLNIQRLLLLDQLKMRIGADHLLGN